MREDNAVKTGIAAAYYIIGGLIWLATFLGAAYVAIHFIAKYW